jgi:hypothetical protein
MNICLCCLPATFFFNGPVFASQVIWRVSPYRLYVSGITEISFAADRPLTSQLSYWREE